MKKCFSIQKAAKKKAPHPNSRKALKLAGARCREERLKIKEDNKADRVASKIAQYQWFQSELQERLADLKDFTKEDAQDFFAKYLRRFDEEVDTLARRNTILKRNATSTSSRGEKAFIMAERSMFLATLVEMGFDQKQSELALTKTSNNSIQSAMDWIMEHPDWESELPKTAPPGETSTAPSGETEGEPADPENPEAIPVEPAKPLTAEEKKERAAALQERLVKARDKRLEEEKKDRVEREKSRRQDGQQLGTIKQDYNDRMMKKQVEERRRQKVADAAAKKRVTDQIASDKAARIAKNAAAKSTAVIAETSPLVLEKREEAKKARPAPTNTRIQFRLPDGTRLVQVFEADEDLNVLIRYAHLNTGLQEHEFKLVSGGMPPTKFTDADRDRTLADLSLVPSAVVMVQKNAT